MTGGPWVEVADERPAGALAVDAERVAAVANLVLTSEGRSDTRLSVTLVDDAHIAELHQQYMGIPGPTDVLAFPLEDDVPVPEPILGDVIVSVDTAAREAKERGLPQEEELLRYVVHGTLHLLGYDDHEEEDRQRMHARQEALLSQFLSA